MNKNIPAHLLDRRELLRSGVAVLTVLGLSRQSTAENLPPARPNILLLHCHDLGAYLHCYGAETVQSPNLDALAAGGVRFARNFCTAPQCSPSRASIFTGRYPHNNGVMGLCHAEFAWDLNPEEVHLAQLLKDAGYRAESVGIIHETRSGAARCGYEKHAGKNRASEMASAAIERLRYFAETPEKPFFLCAGCIEPHRMRFPEEKDYIGFLSPEFGPDETLGVNVPGFLRDTPGTRSELAELQGAVRHMDVQMGRIVSALSELELEQNTLVVFTTDHGYAMPRAKCSLYDPGIATAFILRLPSRPGWHGGIVKEELVSNIDLLPTLLDVAGVPIPSNVQGRSLMTLLDGDAYSARDTIFAEISHHDYYDPRRCIRTETHKLIANFASAPAYMDPSQSWRPRSDTVVPEDHATAYHPCLELYDLRTDPWEQNNIAEAPEHSETRAMLLDRLRYHLIETEDSILDGAITPPQHGKTLGLMGLPSKR